MKSWNKRLGVYVDQNLHDALARQAEEEQRDMSTVARRVLEDYLRAQYKARKETYPGQQRLSLRASRKKGAESGQAVDR